MAIFKPETNGSFANFHGICEFGLLEFRDKCFLEYHKSDKFLKKIEKKFGKKAIENIKKITSIKLKRKILEKNY